MGKWLGGAFDFLEIFFETNFFRLMIPILVTILSFTESIDRGITGLHAHAGRWVRSSGSVGGHGA